MNDVASASAVVGMPLLHSQDKAQVFNLKGQERALCTSGIIQMTCHILPCLMVGVSTTAIINNN